MYHIYVYNFGAGQKKWCSTCYRCNSQFGAYAYKEYKKSHCTKIRLLSSACQRKLQNCNSSVLCCSFVSFQGIERWCSTVESFGPKCAIIYTYNTQYLPGYHATGCICTIYILPKYIHYYPKRTMSKQYSSHLDKACASQASASLEKLSRSRYLSI